MKLSADVPHQLHSIVMYETVSMNKVSCSRGARIVLLKGTASAVPYKGVQTGQMGNRLDRGDR